MEINSQKMQAMMLHSLRQAIGMTMIKKRVNQDAQSIQNILEMAKDVAKITGKGQHLDLRG